MPEAKFVSEALLNHGINLKYRPKIRVALSGLYCTVLGLQSYHRTIDGHNLRSVLKPPLARELKDGSWGEFRPDYSLRFQSLGMWKEALKQIKLAEEALRVALAEERNPELRAALMGAYKETLAASATLSFDQHNAAKLNQHIFTLDAARLALVPLAAVDFTRGAGQIPDTANPIPSASGAHDFPEIPPVLSTIATVVGQQRTGDVHPMLSPPSSAAFSARTSESQSLIVTPRAPELLPAGPDRGCRWLTEQLLAAAKCGKPYTSIR